MQIVNEKWRAIFLDIGLLLMRVVFCGLIVSLHGWDKLSHFSQTTAHFPDPIGLGSRWSAILVMFAEFACGIAVLLGMATRLALIPMIISMSVAFFIVHGSMPMDKKELPLLYLASFVVLLFTGPGRYSVDALISRWGGGKTR